MRTYARPHPACEKANQAQPAHPAPAPVQKLAQPPAVSVVAPPPDDHPSDPTGTSGTAVPCSSPFTFQPATAPFPSTAVAPENVGPPPTFVDRPWIVDNTDTRAILESFANDGSMQGIPETLKSLQVVMGNSFCERCWSKCLDRLCTAPDEECLFTVSGVFQLYEAPHAMDHVHPRAFFGQEHAQSNRLEEFRTMQAELL